MTEQVHFHFSLSCVGEGNGNPLQCSYLENPRDSGAWWTAVYGVAQSRTWLKRLSSSSSSNTYIWNLEKWYWRIYLQGSNGETDIENKLMDMERGEERVRLKKKQNTRVLRSASSVLLPGHFKWPPKYVVSSHGHQSKRPGEFQGSGVPAGKHEEPRHFLFSLLTSTTLLIGFDL